MAGSNGRADTRVLGNNTAEEAVEARARVAEIDPNFVADPNASFQTNFIEALGLKEASTIGGFLDKIGIRDATNIANQDDLRAELKNISPEAMLDAVAKADPSQQEIIDLIKEDPELSEAIHSAVVNDPTMLDGLQEALEDDGSAADLKEILENDMQRGILTKVLEKIADGSEDADGNDIDYSHMKKIMEADNMADKLAAVQAAGVSVNNPFNIESFGDLIELLKNPGPFIQDFIESLGIEDPRLEAFAASIGDGASRALGNFVDPQGDWVGYYVQEGAPIVEAIIEHGETVLAADHSDTLTGGARDGDTTIAGGAANDRLGVISEGSSAQTVASLSADIDNLSDGKTLADTQRELAKDEIGDRSRLQDTMYRLRENEHQDITLLGEGMAERLEARSAEVNSEGYPTGTPTGTEIRTSGLEGGTHKFAFDPAATGASMMEQATQMAEATVKTNVGVTTQAPAIA